MKEQTASYETFVYPRKCFEINHIFEDSDVTVKTNLCNRIKFFLSMHELQLCSHIVCVEEIPLFLLRLVTVNFNKHCWVYLYVTVDIGYSGRLMWYW